MGTVYNFRPYIIFGPRDADRRGAATDNIENYTLSPVFMGRVSCYNPGP